MNKLILFVCLSLSIVTARAWSGPDFHITKWFNGTYTFYNLPNRSLTDLVDVTVDYKRIQSHQWFEEEHPTNIIDVFRPIYVSIGAQSDPFYFEMFNAACHYNRTYEDGKFYKEKGYNPIHDPCIQYVENYRETVEDVEKDVENPTKKKEDAVDNATVKTNLNISRSTHFKNTIDRQTEYTIDHIIRNAVLQGKYVEGSIRPCVEHSWKLAKRSFDYEAYVDELSNIVTVSETKIHSDYKEILTSKGHFYCHQKKTQCYMNKNLFIARCAILYSRFKNMKLQ